MRVEVSTTVKSIFEFPEGLTIEEIRREVLSRLDYQDESDEEESATSQLQMNHDNAAYLGQAIRCSVEMQVTACE